MPSINDGRKVIKTIIPSIPGSEVELWDSLTVGDSEKIQALETDTAKGISTMVCLIKSWNLDEPCNEENVKKLSANDFEALIMATGLADQLKKKQEEIEDDQVEKKTL